MIHSASNLRLQQLEEKINKVLKLLSEYEEELLDEDDPGRKNRCLRRIENLKQQKSSYENEFNELQVQLQNTCPIQTQNISTQLQAIDCKIKLIQENQDSLSNILRFHFNHTEQELLLPFTQKLDRADLIEVRAFLEAVESDQTSGEEALLILTNIQMVLKRLLEKDLMLPEDTIAVSKIINSPTVEAKHALKISIPIIPFILAYEGELGLGTVINLKELWERWKNKS